MRDLTTSTFDRTDLSGFHVPKRPRRDYSDGMPVDLDGNPTPYWLEGVLGSLSEERASSRPRSYDAYNSQVRKARKFSRGLLTLDQFLLNESEAIIKLSDLEAWYPSLSFDFRINIQELTKSNMKLLRSFLFYYIQLECSPWIEKDIEESLDSFLTPEKVMSGGKTFRECFIIRQTYLILGKRSCLSLLQSLYSDHNIEVWTNTGKNLSKAYTCVKIPFAYLKEKVRRRGYHESSSNKFKLQPLNKRRRSPVMVNKSPEAIELEETKQRILLKQAKLFEQRLDSYLRISDQEISLAQRKEEFQRLIEVPEVEFQFRDSQIQELEQSGGNSNEYK